MKIKLVSASVSSKEFEKQVNEAMSGLNVKDIKFTEIANPLDGKVYTTAYIIYDDRMFETVNKGGYN